MNPPESEPEAGPTEVDALIRVREEIEDMLVARRMSRSDLARSMDVTPGMITQMLSGEYNPTVRLLCRVADALGCTLSILLVPDGQEVP